MRPVLILALSFTLGACGSSALYPTRPDAEDFDVGMAKCRMGMAGLPIAPSQPNSMNSGVAMQNLGASLGEAANRQAYMENCMLTMGWRRQ